jgi:hypothetical protein
MILHYNIETKCEEYVENDWVELRPISKIFEINIQSEDAEEQQRIWELIDENFTHIGGEEWGIKEKK